MEVFFSELRNKEVINVVDGKLLGRICDLVIDTCSSRILGLVVPGNRSFFSFFKSCDDICIPYCNICKIGCDVILVEVFNCNNNRGRKNGGNTRILSDDGDKFDNLDSSANNNGGQNLNSATTKQN